MLIIAYKGTFRMDAADHMKVMYHSKRLGLLCSKNHITKYAFIPFAIPGALKVGTWQIFDAWNSARSSQRVESDHSVYSSYLALLN